MQGLKGLSSIKGNRRPSVQPLVNQDAITKPEGYVKDGLTTGPFRFLQIYLDMLKIEKDNEFHGRIEIIGCGLCELLKKTQITFQPYEVQAIFQNADITVSDIEDIEAKLTVAFESTNAKNFFIFNRVNPEFEKPVQELMSKIESNIRGMNDKTEIKHPKYQIVKEMYPTKKVDTKFIIATQSLTHSASKYNATHNVTQMLKLLTDPISNLCEQDGSLYIDSGCIRQFLELFEKYDWTKEDALQLLMLKSNSTLLFFKLDSVVDSKFTFGCHPFDPNIQLAATVEDVVKITKNPNHFNSPKRNKIG